MKKTIKIAAIFLSFIMILSFSLALTTSAFVTFPKELSTDEKIEYLISHGMPQSLFEDMEDPDVEDMFETLYGEEFEFLGTETVSMSEMSSEISPLGVIPSEDMTLRISRTMIGEYDEAKKLSRLKQMYIYVNYTWASGHPFITGEDGISVNWNSSVFTFKANSFKATDYKRTLSSNGEWITTSTWNNPSALSQGGLGYYARLTYSETAMGQTIGAIQHKGSASFVLLPAIPIYTTKNGPYNTSINAEYLHNKNILPFSISFGYNGFGVSVSVSGLSDSVAVASTYSYDK